MYNRVTEFYAKNYGKLVRQTCPHYDVLQKQIGQAVASMLPSGLEKVTLLEIGMGWGDTTKAILNAVPHATVWSCESNTTMRYIAEKRLRSYADIVSIEEYEAFNLLTYLNHLKSAGALEQERILIKGIEEGSLQSKLQQLLDQRTTIGLHEGVDGIFSGFTIHNIGFQKRFHLIRQIFAYLKQGGIFVNGDKYAHDSTAEHYAALRTLFARVDGIKNEDLREHEKEHFFEDNHPEYIMIETPAKEQLENIGFVDVQTAWREETEAVVVARKPIKEVAVKK